MNKRGHDFRENRLVLYRVFTWEICSYFVRPPQTGFAASRRYKGDICYLAEYGMFTHASGSVCVVTIPTVVLFYVHN